MTSDTTFNGADIFVYSYPTALWASMSIDELAENMRLQLDVNLVSAYRRLIFLTHSMGGLVTRAYLLKNRDVAARTAFAYFFSTPTTGSQIASLATLISRNPQFSKMKPIDAENYLGDLLRQWLAAELRIPSYCAYEKKSTYSLAIVTFQSASALCTKALDPIEADHINIVKPADRNATPYLAFKAAYVRETASWRSGYPVAPPLSMALVDGETKPLDGYKFAATPALPNGLDPGTLLPGGGHTRILFQATDPDKILEIGRVTLLISRREVPDKANLTYTVDPTRQSGFGAARPRRFNIRLIDSSRADIFYINDAKKPFKVQPDNILAGTDFPLLRLDRSAGLQETLDLSFVAAGVGLYEMRLVAHVTSQGSEYVLQTRPLYIVRI